MKKKTNLLIDSFKPRSRQYGFSLLEAIVALAILTGTGMALLGWMNTNLLSISKIEERSHKNELIRSASEFMQNVDIMAKQTGREKLSRYEIAWTSETVEPEKDGVNKTGKVSDFRMGLYDTKVDITIDNQLVTSFNIRLVGYSQEREYQRVF